MSSSRSNKRTIFLFLGLTLLFSSLFYFFIIFSGSLSNGGGKYVMGLMWCPGLAALITMLLLGRDLSEMGWKWGSWRYQWWSYFIPIIYSLIAYISIWVIGWGDFYNIPFVESLEDSFGLGNIGQGFTLLLYVMLTGSIAVIRGMSSALGEEIGWRGLLTPLLYKEYGFTSSSLITGLVWGGWHLPVLLFADYNSGTPLWYAMSCFMFLVIAVSFIYTWFRIKSGSLWTAVILHASHNVFIQQIFTPLTSKTDNSAYFIDEFGIVLPIVITGMAIYFWTRRKELP